MTDRRRAHPVPAIQLRSTEMQHRVPLVQNPCVQCHALVPILASRLPFVWCHARAPLTASPLPTLPTTWDQCHVGPLRMATQIQVAHMRHHVCAKFGQMSRSALYSGVR